MMQPQSFFEVPEAVKARLRRNESGQRSRAKAMNKKLIARNAVVKDAHQLELIIIEKFDIIALYEEQEWMCQCWRVPGYDGCYKYVDVTKAGQHPDAPCLGHINNLDNGGHHVADNIGIMRHSCNMAIAHTIEKTRSAKTERQRRTHSGVKKNGQKYVKKKKKAIPARAGGLQSSSKLQSKSQWPKVKKPWPKRKFGQ